MLEDYEQYNCQNWDGEDAAPITPDTLSLARAVASIMASEVSVAPGADGSIGFEWVTSEGKVFFDVGPESNISIYVRVGNTFLTKAAKIVVSTD